MRALKIFGYVLGMIVTSVHTLIGVIVMAVFYRAHSWRWSQGCIECVAGRVEKRHGKMLTSVTRIWGRPGAQTWGFAIVYSSHGNRKVNRLRVHERVHVIQSMVLLDIFYVLSYCLHFAVLFVWFKGTDKTPRWKVAYYRVWAEQQAYRIDREYGDGKRPDAFGLLVA